MKKFLAILLSALMMLALFAGCSDKGDDDKKKEEKETTTTTEKAEEPTSKADKEEPDEDYDINNLPTFDKIEIAQPTGAVWEADMDGITGTVSAGYCVNSGVIDEIIVAFEIPTSVMDYNGVIAAYEEYDVNAYNDPNMTLDFIKNADSTEVVFSFTGLNESDRALRVAGAADIIGFDYDESDFVVYFDDLNTSLVEEGFTKK